MTQQVWEQDEIIQPAPQQPAAPQRPARPATPQRAPGVIQGPPAPPRAPDPVVERNFETGRGDEGFDRLTTYRNEFFDSPAVRDFEEVRIQAEQIARLAERGGSAMGDIGLVFSFMKTLDPGSTVRDGEFATAAEAAGVPERILAGYNRLVSGERLSEDQRRDMAQTAQELVRSRAPAYNATVDRYARLIEAEGVDPATQGIERYGRPFGGVEVTRRPQRPTPTLNFEPEQDPQQATPIARDLYPQGAQLRADTWGQDNVFDRLAQLSEWGITEDAEQQLVGRLNARSRERVQTTPEDVLSIYRDLNIPPPDDAGLQELVGKVNGGGTFSGIDVSEAEEVYRGRLSQYNEQIGRDDLGNENLANQGGLGGFNDEIRGLEAGAAALFSDQSPVAAYQVARDAERLAIEGARERGGAMGTAAEIGGALLSGGVRAGPSAANAGRAAYQGSRLAGNAPAVARSAATSAARLAPVREGAILGGVTGFGYGEGPVNSLVGTGIGGLGGGIVGGTVQAGFNALAPQARNFANFVRGNKATVNAADVRPIVEAGERAGVTVRRADVDPNVRARRGQVLQTERGARLRQAETDDLQEMETALVRSLGGGTTDRVSGGVAIQSGIRGARDRIRTEASNNYRAARAQSNDVRVQPTRAIDAIDTEIAELTRLGANRNKSQIAYLRELREDLASEDGLGIDVIRAQRTGLRQELNNRSLYSNDFERRIGGILDAAGEDIAAGLADNPQALARYQRADELWRQQAEFGEQIGDVLLGRNAANPRAPADTAAAVMDWARKDPARLARMIDEAGPEVADEVRAMIANELGRAGNNSFQLGAFLTQTSGGPRARLNPQATRALFGEEGARAIADLRVLARAKTDAAEMTNRSNSGNVISRAVNGLRTMMLGGMGVIENGATGGAVAGASGALITRLGEARSLRLLLNPDFTGWLRRLPDTSNPRAIDSAFDRLRRVASRTPGMAADVQALERALVGVANDNAVDASRTVAEEEPQADQNQRP